jgi:excisionase family DNA binding protein
LQNSLLKICYIPEMRNVAATISFVYASGMSEDSPVQDFYSTEEAAKVLGIGTRRIQQLAGDGLLEGERHGRSWRLARWSVHRYLEEHGPGRPRVSRMGRERPSQSPESVREWVDRVNALERELGRLEGRLELTERAESTIREERDRLLEERERERERAERLEEERERLRGELEAERSKGFWRRLFGG